MIARTQYAQLRAKRTIVLLTSERSEEVPFFEVGSEREENRGVTSVRKRCAQEVAEGIVAERRNSDRRSVWSKRRYCNDRHQDRAHTARVIAREARKNARFRNF